MIIKLDNQGRLKLDEFKNFLDVTKVVYYKLETLKDKTLSLKFYDKNKRLIKPKKKKYYQLIFYSNDLVFSPFIVKFDSLQKVYQALETCKKYKDQSYYIQEVTELEFYESI